jgi:Xaa-Pro aminopeptidase
VASDSSHGALIAPPPDLLDLRADYGRVMQTASDRPEEDSLPPLSDPAADRAEGPVAARRADVDEKQRRVAALLDATGHDALVLGRADSVAWFTSGGDLAQCLGSEASSALLFLNRTSRAVITDNVQSARVFEEELAGLGFQLKERPWYDDPGRVVAELGHGKRLITDLGPCSCAKPWPREADPVRALRRPLTVLERQWLRELGRTLALAVEATCRNFDRGETEADIAGHLAHRLVREGVVPVDLRVAGDDRLERYRQPTFKAAPIERRATISVAGRRHGLCAALTRTVSFGPPGRDFEKQHGLAAMVDATCIYFSRPGETVSGVFRRARRIFEKFDHPHEWTLDYLGHVIGYAPRELLLLPDSPAPLESDTALCWSPSVGPARSEDTVVIDHRGYEVVTEAQNWPKLEVTVKGFQLTRPGILQR